MRHLAHALAAALLAVVASLSSGCDAPAHAFAKPTGMFKASGITNPCTQISGCAVWLRADLGITQSGGKVTAWADQSGNSYSATAGSTGVPYHSSGGLNSQAYLEFDTSDYYSWAYNVGTGAKTWAVVLTFTNPGGGGQTVWFYSGGGNSGELLADLSGYDFFSFNDDFSVGASINGISDSLAAGVGGILLYTYDGSGQATTDYTASLNGTAKTVSSSGAYGQPAGTSRIGFRPTNAFIYYGHLHEIVGYDHVLSAGDQAALVAYLRARYGL